MLLGQRNKAIVTSAAIKSALGFFIIMSEIKYGDKTTYFQITNLFLVQSLAPTGTSCQALCNTDFEIVLLCKSSSQTLI